MKPADALRELSDASDEDLGKLLLRASRAINASVIERLVALGHPGIRASHAAVFMNLDAQGSRVVTLAQRADMTRQGMSALVQELQVAGYVEVHPDPTDGRAIRVRLTGLGVKFCHQAAKAVRELEAEWSQLLGAAGLEQLRKSLRALTAGPPPR